MNEFVNHPESIAGFLTGWDYAIILAGLGAMLVVGMAAPYFRPKTKWVMSDPIEYCLMGRRLSLPFFVATLVSTWYGGFFMATQVAFEKGVYTLFTQGLVWHIPYLIFAVWLVKPVRMHQARSLPDLIGKQFGREAQVTSAIFLFFKTLPMAYAAGLGLILQLIWGIPLPLAIFLGVSFVGLYSFVGGLRSVVLTDVIQFLLMFAGVIALVCFSYLKVGDHAYLRAHLPLSHFSLAHHGGKLFFWLLIACTSTFLSPVFYERCLAAQSDHVARWGILLSIPCWLLFDLCILLGALYARACVPEAPSSQAYLIYGLQVLPTGFRGLLILSVLATVLSTLDSYLFSSSSILLGDLFKTRVTQGTFVRVGLLFALATLSIGLYSAFSYNFEAIHLIKKRYLISCITLPFVWSLFTPRVRGAKILGTTACVSACLITLYDALAPKHWMDSIYLGLLSSALILLLFQAVSHKKPRNAKECPHSLRALEP